MPIIDAELTLLNEQFEHAHPQTILRWAWELLRPSVVATSSFQTQSVPLLHMISRVAPAMPVLFLDTGFHFPETLAFRDQLATRFGLNVRVLTAAIGHAGFRRQHWALYRSDPDLCCYINKVEPTRTVLEGVSGWVTGIRRDQTATRRQAEVLSRRPDGTIRVCPMLCWGEEEVLQYLDENALPRHPLLAQGYVSIGCAPCTRPVGPGDAVRAGRWAGSAKTECGLHDERRRVGEP